MENSFNTNHQQMKRLPLKIAASILAADYACLGNEIETVAAAGADWIHIDVMDGHFVPNIAFGPDAVKSLRDLTRLPFDVHLMISPIDSYIKAFANAGANILTVHPEAGPHLHRTLQVIKDCGVKTGVALNPATPIEMILPVIDEIDLILVMSVNPGFGGQKFIETSLKKIKELRHIIDQRNLPISLEVDGGITVNNAAKIVDAGADVLVTGHAIFYNDGQANKFQHYSDRIMLLRGNI